MCGLVSAKVKCPWNNSVWVGLMPNTKWKQEDVISTLSCLGGRTESLLNINFFFFLQGLNPSHLQKPRWQRHGQEQLCWAPALSSEGMRMNSIQPVQLPHWNWLETNYQSYHLLMPGHLCFSPCTKLLLLCLLMMTAHRKAFMNQASWQGCLGLILKLQVLLKVWNFVGDCTRIVRNLLLLS